MSNEITYGDQSREAILRGINRLANAVKVTLGVTLPLFVPPSRRPPPTDRRRPPFCSVTHAA